MEPADEAKGEGEAMKDRNGVEVKIGAKARVRCVERRRTGYVRKIAGDGDYQHAQVCSTEAGDWSWAGWYSERELVIVEDKP